MKAAGLLLELVRNGVQVGVEGDELCMRGAKGSLRPALREEILRRKQEILILLEQQTKYVLPSLLNSGWGCSTTWNNTPTSNISNAFRLSGTLDAEALTRSLSALWPKAS